MNSYAPRARAFTLIELLTVITIIAILMAMLFPFINGAKETARNRRADQEVRAIVHAVQQYNVEYGTYPNIAGAAAPTAAPTDTAVGDQAANISERNSVLFNTLRSIDRAPNTNHELNPRRVVFYEGKQVSKPSSPRDGFLDSSSGAGSSVGSLFDPWGNEYCVVIDTNSDNMVDVAQYYTDFPVADSPRQTVGAFTIGKDKQLGKRGDQLYKNGNEYADDRVSWSSH